jgi:hypothetical protein
VSSEQQAQQQCNADLHGIDFARRHWIGMLRAGLRRCQ